MTDSSVSEGTNKAKTDVTFCYVPNAFTSKGYNKNGRTLYVASYDLKCGDAFKAVAGRLRIYQKQTVVTCTNGATETKTTGELLSTAKNLFTYDTSYGVLRANGVAAGIFSEDAWTNFTIAYDYALDTAYLYVNGVYVTKATAILAKAEGTASTFFVKSTNHYDAAETWTSGKDTEDTADDNYTKVSYEPAKILVDSHFGGDAVFAGRFLSAGSVRCYYTSPATAFENAEDPATYIDGNKAPANGVFKDEATGFYYYYENGFLQGAKTVTVGSYKLVLAPETGRITNVYIGTDVYPTVSASQITALPGTAITKTNITLSSGLNNSGSVKSYVFSKDENGAYIPVLDNGSQVYAAISGGKLYAVTFADGAYSFGDTKVAASIDVTTAYAPLTVDGAAVTMSDGTAVLVKVKAEEKTLPATNVVKKVGNTNIYEFTAKNRLWGENYYASTTNLSLGTKSNIGGDMQIVTGGHKNTIVTPSIVLSFDIKAGEGLDQQTKERIGFGKVRFKTVEGDSNRDDNGLVGFLRNKEDGKYHFLVHNTDAGVFSKNEYISVMVVLTPDWDANEDGTPETYAIEAYANGVKIVEKQQYIRNSCNASNLGTLSCLENIYLGGCGAYFSNGVNQWSEPLLYIGNYHSYAYENGTAPKLVAGSVIEDKNLTYSGYVAFEDGTYGRYENNILVEDGLTDATFATLNQYTATLGEKIGLNFFVDAEALADDEGAKAVFTVGDEKQTVYLKDAPVTENGYKLTALLSSIQMNTPVNLEVYDGNGNRVAIICGAGYYDSFNYSVREYAAHIVNNSSTYGTAAANAAKAMVLYGAFAQRYLTGNKDLSTAGNFISNFEKASVQFSEVGSIAKINSVKDMWTSPTLNVTDTNYDGVNLTGTANDASMLGSIRLVLDSVLKIRIALNVTEVPEITGGALYTEKDDEGNVRYFVDIVGLTAADYNTVQTVTVNGNNINITVLAVANAVASSSAYSTDFRNLARAMYGYYYYSAVYAGIIA